MNERLQFRRLLRSFSYRFLDNEFLSAEGDALQTMVHVLALLGAAALSVSLLFVYKYELWLAGIPATLRDALTWPDKEFLISLAMAVTGLAAVITWDGLFPDRRDCLNLAALPVRWRTMFAAKLTAVLGLFAAVTVALNGPTALFYPWIATGESGGSLIRYVFAHVTAVVAASAFVFFSFLAIQGLLVMTLSFRQYKWISAWVQLGALFAILSAFFLMPDIAHPVTIADPHNRLATHLLPPYWFLAWYQELLGVRSPYLQEMAAMARTGLAISIVTALSAYTAGYGRYVRKTLEEADTLPGDARRRMAWLTRFLDRLFLPKPVERAAFHFAARTMARNRKHRLLLAIYAGVGISYVFKSVGWMMSSGFQRHRFDPGISSVPLVLSFFMLLGMRVLFTIPVELRSNWVFQLTENGRPGDCLNGVRKLMFVVGILPLAVGTFPVYGMLWGWGYATRHAVLVALILMLVAEFLMRRFPKIPFTCSFLPGKMNLKATFVIYCVLFVFGAANVAVIEWALVASPRGYWIGTAAITLVLAWRTWRRHQWERRLSGFVYEERATWALDASLNL